MAGDPGARRAEFWARMSEAAPQLGIGPGTGQERETPLAAHPGLRLKMSISQDKTSVYLIAKTPAAAALVGANLPALAAALRTVKGAATGEAAANRWFRKDIKTSFTLPSRWPELIAWFLEQHARYDAAVAAVAQAPNRDGA